jgi:hypothetical protein
MQRPRFAAVIFRAGTSPSADNDAVADVGRALKKCLDYMRFNADRVTVIEIDWEVMPLSGCACAVRTRASARAVVHIGSQHSLLAADDLHDDQSEAASCSSMAITADHRAL